MTHQALYVEKSADLMLQVYCIIQARVSSGNIVQRNKEFWIQIGRLEISRRRSQQYEVASVQALICIYQGDLMLQMYCIIQARVSSGNTVQRNKEFWILIGQNFGYKLVILR